MAAISQSWVPDAVSEARWMRYLTFELDNYKSFLSSGTLHFSSGFNVIVGQNDVGKTALVEGLALRFDNKPHRSLKTAHTRLAQVHSPSEAHVRFEIPHAEFVQILQAHFGGPDGLPVPRLSEPMGDPEDCLRAALLGDVSVGFTIQPGVVC